MQPRISIDRHTAPRRRRRRRTQQCRTSHSAMQPTGKCCVSLMVSVLMLMLVLMTMMIVLVAIVARS
ncbi:unnamed protein product [Toxocara canis]|uniref:Wsv095 n=1 Tax=Toxocara canis TaxID=6265 RepID=A0A183V3H7_TOXCA|nr:unnamed protein product [Toxocara canis]